MPQCKNPTCQNEVVSIEGRRPKEFCSVSCRTKFHNSKNAKGTGRGRPKGSKNKDKPTTSIGVLKQAIENMGAEPVAVNKGIEDIPFVEIDPEAKPSLIEKATPYVQAATIAHHKLNQLASKPQMPKGLTLTQQLDWREKNLK